MRSIFFILLILFSVPLVMRRPLWGVAIYMGFNVIRPEMLFWGGSTGSYVFMFYFCVTVFSTFLKGNFNRIGQVFQREFMLMIWLVIAILISISFSTYQDIGRQYYFAFDLIKTVAFCILLYVNIDSFDDIYKLENVLIYCFTFMGIWGIEQQFRGNDRLEGLGGNAWGDSNGVAAMFVLILPVALAKLFTSEKRRDLLIIFGCLAILVALIVCTKSRGGLLGLLAGISSFSFFARKTRKIFKIVLILLVVIIPFASGAYLDRVKTLQDVGTENLDSSARNRLILWKAGLMIFADNPVLGSGFMTYPIAKLKYADQFYDVDDRLRTEVFRTDFLYVTHNTYIQLLSECGIIGTIPFILLFTGNYLISLKTRRLIPLMSKEENNKLIYICGITAGIVGYSVCIVFLNLLTGTIFYYQLIISSMLFKTVITSKISNTVNNN